MSTRPAADATDSPIKIEHPLGGVLLIKLNRPQARNSLTMDSWLALEQALDAAAENPELRAVVLSGEGAYFCAGGDLKSTPAAGFRATASVARLDAAQRTMLKMRSFPLPIIAAVEGGAAGLGWSLALACDLLFTASDAAFVAPFVSRGVVPDGGAAWFLAQRVGRHRAAELLFSGRPLLGDEAVAWGLANRAVAGGTVVAAALEYAASLPAAYGHAMELGKRLLDAAETLELKAYYELERVTAALCQNGPEADRARREFQARAAAKPVRDEPNKKA
ncbi:MAG: enoyl-CoA hydratase [Hydrocarboniphaga sp.]|uniref:enoyl-CoA hydratase/isomerase family protein n=1 Tax=Hydrocarboniphaga sp. TaxID=2033016 RepID=UPI0026391AC5|nr:enoyl-CoA hydratase/isomerase family protein [Hydrocarboniphaga sp.]MDB5970016.1 enoyl-CoA hydratase [Hydrocarboniphaga sp.]